MVVLFCFVLSASLLLSYFSLSVLHITVKRFVTLLHKIAIKCNYEVPFILDVTLLSDRDIVMLQLGRFICLFIWIPLRFS